MAPVKLDSRWRWWKGEALGDRPVSPPTNSPASKLPEPIRATAVRFRRDPSYPTIAILEVDTATNPIRIALDKTQIAQLVAFGTRTASHMEH
jgi:hypothetical protein